MSNHTPGPWICPTQRASKYGFPRWKIRFIYGNTLGAIARVLPAGTRDTRQANAHLIAAAPDLLEALKSIENDDGRIPSTIWGMRNAAIAKARGEG